MPHVTDGQLAVIDLHRLAYAPALERQRAIHQSVVEGTQPDTLLLVEHDPVITLSRRGSTVRHLLASPARLAELGIAVEETDRGGDITYHGPGQLVAYPIVRLAPRGLNVGRYVRLLERIIIDTVADFGIRASCERGNPGVWVENAKIAAVGVRIRRNVSMHGLALNVTTDLTHFSTIVPCGLAGRGVTSMAMLLGERTPTFDMVKEALVRHASHRFADPSAVCPAP